MVGSFTQHTLRAKQHATGSWASTSAGIWMERSVSSDANLQVSDSLCRQKCLTTQVSGDVCVSSEASDVIRSTERMVTFAPEHFSSSNSFLEASSASRSCARPCLGNILQQFHCASL